MVMAVKNGTKSLEVLVGSLVHQLLLLILDILFLEEQNRMGQGIMIYGYFRPTLLDR